LEIEFRLRDGFLRWRTVVGAAHNRGMRKLLWLGMILTTASLMLAAETLTRRVSPEEFRGAGLEKLSTEELAQLDALFQKYGAAVVVSAPVPKTTELSSQTVTDAAAVRVAQAEARAVKAEQKATIARTAELAAKAEQQKAEEGFLSKAKKVFVSSGTKVEVMATETEIDGNFDGWDEKTSWRMKDGTMWRVDNKPAPFQAKQVKNPKVKIYPATVNGYWLEFVDIDLKLRVRQIN
jgi:hypothetical protein